MATSTPANANSPANISPVGPPPAITTACSVIATLRPDTSTTHAFRCSHFRRFWLADGDYAARPRAFSKPPVRYKLEVERVRKPFPSSSGAHGQHRAARRGFAAADIGVARLSGAS